MIEETLAKLGWSPSEIKVYIHLLKGCSYANKISAETGINRTNVYEALDRLVNKGVVSFIIKNKVKWYEAKKPESLLSIIDAKEEELTRLKEEMKKDLKGLKSEPSDRLEATIFTGKKGLRMLFGEMINLGRPISIIASQWQFKEYFGPYFELWHKERIEKRIRQRSIFPEKFRENLPRRRLLEYRFVENKYMSPTTTILFGNNCIFIQWGKETIAVKISNKEIVQSHLNYFNLLWRISKK